ncbi:MAG: OmpA family protein [bacterium]
MIIFFMMTLLLGNADFLHAQIQTSKFGIGLLVGGAKLIGDIENTNTAFTAGLILRYNPFPFFAISTNSTYGTMTSGLDAFKSNVFNTTLSGTFFFLPNSKYRPFLTFGLSNFYYATKDGSGHQLYETNGSAIAGWETAFQMGVGFELFTGKQWAINTFGDYMFSRGDGLDGIKQGQNTGFFRGLIGLIHYFKKNNKTKDEDKYSESWRHIKNHLDFDEVNNSPLPTTENALNSKTLTKSNLFSEGIYFMTGSSIIHEKSRPQLNKIYRYLLANPDEEIELSALNKNHVKLTPNQEMIYARAKSIKIYLVNLGIKPSRIIINKN